MTRRKAHHERRLAQSRDADAARASRRDGQPAPPSGARRESSSGVVLLIAAFGAFLAFLDSTVVNVAFPAIQRYFHSDVAGVSWVLNGYNIAFAALLVAGGRLADLLGRKRTFIYGVGLFTVASSFCALANSVGELVVFRVLQGIGAAVLVPASLALVVERFEPSRRAHAVGLWGAAAAIASGLGPPIGGALVDVSWRWVFLVNLPMGVAAVVVAGRELVESHAVGRRRLFDLRGAALLTAGLGFLTLGIVKGPTWGWTSAAVTVSLLASVVAMVAFVLSSRQHPVPLIDPALLRIRSFVVGSILTVVAGAGLYAYLLTHVFFLHLVWGYSLLQAGLAITPAPFVAAVVAGLLGRVADRHGYRMIIAVGALIWCASMIWYSERAGLNAEFLTVWLPGQILQGIGIGATLPVLGSAAVAELEVGGSYATAAAVVSAARQVGAVIGVALLVVVLGPPAQAAAEHGLRHGWALSAVCFAVVAAAAVSFGHIRLAAEEPAGPKRPLPSPPPGT